MQWDEWMSGIGCCRVRQSRAHCHKDSRVYFDDDNLSDTICVGLASALDGSSCHGGMWTRCKSESKPGESWVGGRDCCSRDSSLIALLVVDDVRRETRCTRVHHKLLLSTTTNSRGEGNNGTTARDYSPAERRTKGERKHEREESSTTR
jgi:hypothetical protein